MEASEAIEVTADAAFDGDSTSPVARDYENDARQMGWTPKEEFKGDEKRWIDAETFVKRGEEVLPLVKAQNKKLRQDIDDMRRQLRKASEHFAKSEERAYQRALSEVERKHDEAVDVGDHNSAKAAVKEMRELEKDFEARTSDLPTADEPEEDPSKLQARVAKWIDDSPWYGADEKRTNYADFASNAIITQHGALHKFPGGLDAALKEIERRVDAKFAERPPTPNAAPGRAAPAKGGRSYAELPPEAKKLADKWVKQGLIKSREDYAKSYDWS